MTLEIIQGVGLKQHDHTGASDGGVLTGDQHDSFSDWAQIAEPASPGSGTLRLYVVDQNGHPVLEIKGPAGLSRRLARDSMFIGRVDEAGGVAAGEVVYISGATGANELIKKARADADATMPGAGIALEAGVLNAHIRVLFLGKIGSLNTSAFTEGDRLFVSAATAGALTNVAPAHPNLRQRIAIVTRSNISTGELLVLPVGLRGDHEGTNQNTWLIGDNTAGAKSVKFVAGASAVGTLQMTPTANRTVTIPDAAGEVSLLGQTIGTAEIENNAVDDSKLRDSAATSVIGRAAGTSGDPADIAASADGQFLRRAAGSLAFGAIASGDLPDPTLVQTLQVAQDTALQGDISPSFGTSQNDWNPTGLADATVIRATATAGSLNITGLVGGADGRVILLLNVGTNNFTLTNEDVASTAANRFAINSNTLIEANRGVFLLYDSTSSRWRIGQTLPGAGGTGDNITVNAVSANDANFSDTTPAAPAGGVNVKWQKDAAAPDNISANLAANDVSNTVLADMAANTVKARAASTTGDPGDVAVGTNTVLGRQAADIVAAQVATAQVANNAIDDTKLRDSAANSVIGRAAATLGDPADIAIGANTVLGRQAADIVAAQVATGQIANNAVDNTKASDMAANTVKANATASLADPADLAVGTNTVVGRVAGNIVAAQVATDQVANNAVNFAKMQDLTTDRLMGRDTAATGDPEELTVGGGVEFTGAGGIQRSALTGAVTASAGSNATSQVVSRTGTVILPVARNIIAWRAPFACTVTNVRGYRVGGTGATINARRNGTSTHLASNLSLTSADTWQDGGAVQNTAYIAGDKLEIMIASVTGAPDQVAIQVDFTRP